MIGLGKMLDKTKPRISYPAATFQTSSHGRLEHGMTFVAGVSRLFLKDFCRSVWSLTFLRVADLQMGPVTGIRQHVLSHPKCRKVRQLRWWSRVACLVVDNHSHGDGSCHSFHAIWGCSYLVISGWTTVTAVCDFARWLSFDLPICTAGSWSATKVALPILLG